MKTVTLGKKGPLTRGEVLEVARKVKGGMVRAESGKPGAPPVLGCHTPGRRSLYLLVCSSEEDAVQVRRWLREGGYLGPLDLSTPEEFAPHPAAGLFPLMGDAELDELAADIGAHGLREPIVIHEAKVLDGRNRLEACRRAGVKPRFDWWEPARPGWTGVFKGSPVDLVLSLNLHRRHLTAEQKREVIAAVLKSDPSKSDRRVAGQVKADHKTVGKVRAEMEGRGEIPHVEARADTAGRQQPAARTGPRNPPGKAPGGGQERRAPGPACEPISLPVAAGAVAAPVPATPAEEPATPADLAGPDTATAAPRAVLLEVLGDGKWRTPKEARAAVASKGLRAAAADIEAALRDVEARPPDGFFVEAKHAEDFDQYRLRRWPAYARELPRAEVVRLVEGIGPIIAELKQWGRTHEFQMSPGRCGVSPPRWRSCSPR